jgi:uncharacterized YigZ family protein
MKEQTNITDVYKTVAVSSGDVLFKEKGSKFIGYVYPVQKEAEIKDIILALKKQHHTARHWCYAWQLGVDRIRYRINDDGEPGNSAGQPIYGQIQAFGLTNVLVVIVRYFGGVKLGVGGLIQAYKTTAKWTLNEASIVKRVVQVNLQIGFEYKDMDKVRRIIKEEKLDLLSEQLELTCRYVVTVRKRDMEKVMSRFENLRCLIALTIL